jgi:1-deoxy-D-xylulose-5-phosphate synthase
MGLYDIAYMLSVPNMTVAAPKDGKELVGLLRCALAHKDGPFSLRYPRDNAPSVGSPAAEVAAIEYGSWEILRRGSDCAILATGVMCGPAVQAAEQLAETGLDVTVVNGRFIKPLDRRMLRSLVEEHRFLVTVEDGTEVNGFGTQVAAAVEAMAPEVRVFIMGVPDGTYEHASRSAQLAAVGLSAEGIAEHVREWAGKESLSTT